MCQKKTVWCEDFSRPADAARNAHWPVFCGVRLAGKVRGDTLRGWILRSPVDRGSRRDSPIGRIFGLCLLAVCAAAPPLKLAEWNLRTPVYWRFAPRLPHRRNLRTRSIGGLRGDSPIGGIFGLPSIGVLRGNSPIGGIFGLLSIGGLRGDSPMNWFPRKPVTADWAACCLWAS